jgi:hypothetical protein
MSEHTITLSDAEELVLGFWLERINASRARQEEDTLPLDIDQLLLYTIRNDLINLRNELNSRTDDLWSVARNLNQTQRTALLAQVPDGARKVWLQFRLQSGQ